MIINDLKGQIRIEEKYEKIINSKEFQNLKNRNQLGLNTNPNSLHTRFGHSIGVYSLAIKLINICKEKFSDIVKITKEDEEAIKCMALLHDIGHGPFSHVSEKFLNGSHENNTIDILLDEKSEINNIIIKEFGSNVLNKIIDLIKMKERVHDNKETIDDINLSFIVSKLLSGGIDIDRLDYIFRDSKYALCEDNDFSSILDSIGLEYIDESLEIVFPASSEYTISNFLNKRFELYDTLYLNNETRVIEEVFGKLLERLNYKLSWHTSEIELNNLFRESLESKDEIIRRYASVLMTKSIDSNFIIKEINDKDEYAYFIKRILSSIPELEKYSSCVFSSYAKANTYKKENKIFINKDGVIKDILESSKILNSELIKEKYILGVDLYLLRKLLERDNIRKEDIDRIISKIKKLTSPEIEQEKKYVLNSISINSNDDFKCIRNTFNLKDPEYIKNTDTYYDYNGILENQRIAVRKRIVNGDEEWNVKRPLNDKSSILKREEKTFASKNEVIEFLEKEWGIRVLDLEKVITLKTHRVKCNLECKGGIFELVFDKTIPVKDEIEYEPNYMIECELKSGNSSGFYFIDKSIKKIEFIKECKLSKKEAALEKIKTKENDFSLVYK